MYFCSLSWKVSERHLSIRQNFLLSLTNVVFLVKVFWILADCMLQCHVTALYWFLESHKSLWKKPLIKTCCRRASLCFNGTAEVSEAEARQLHHRSTVSFSHLPFAQTVCES